MPEDATPGHVVLERLRSLLSFYTSVPEDRLSAASTPENTNGWDSVANLWLLAAVEEEFDISIGTRDAIHLRSLGTIAEYVESTRRKEGKGPPAKASSGGG